MTTRRIRELFGTILQLEPDRRQEALDRACGNDGHLRAEVASLLQAHDQAGAFMGNPTKEYAAVNQRPTEIGEGPGSVIGRYKLLQQIGEGGFGVVFMAQQTHPIKRRVALKIIKLGMDTRQVIARFEAERQALALMDHLHIAQVLDAGATDTGRPFFVMELVRGDPITEYCNREKLATDERLALFIQVCRAIQHAHQKGIIHRDLKPSNVLVTITDSRPLAKVIDFGIAKATNTELTEKTLFTEFRQFIGTPEYMSPEQADRSATDIDTRSDIYSLGVLLYEMLTGTTPLDGKKLRSAAWAELQRMIRDDEPPSPSTRVSTMGDALPTVARQRSVEPTKLGDTLRGELDWVVMKAIDKDRTRRYATADALADDVQRYLDNETVEAVPASLGYRLRKLSQRHRTAIAAALLVLVVLLIGLAGTSAGLVWALRERDRAQEAEQVAADQVLRAKRYISMIGSPLMQPNDIHRFKNEWQVELDQSRALRGADDLEQITDECRFAAWLGFASLANDLYDLAVEARSVQEEVYPRAIGKFAPQDPVYTSFVLSHLQTIVFVTVSQRDPTSTEWLEGIDPSTARRMLPLYKDLMEGLKGYIPEDDARYQQIGLEQVWMQFRAGQHEQAIPILESYAGWYERNGIAPNTSLLSLHRKRIQLAVEVLAEFREDYPELYGRMNAISQKESEPARGNVVEADSSPPPT